MEPDYEFEYEILPLEVKDKIALEFNYKDLINLCKTSRGVFGEICGSNGFWKQKTYYDFEDLYDIEPIIYNIKDLYEDFQGDWWETYQHYRERFTDDLIRAIEGKNLEEAERLLRINKERGFLIVDETDEDGYTALMRASSRGYTAIVKMLLNAGANPNLANKNGNTPLMWASQKDHAAIVEMLLNAEANPNLANEDGWTALMAASQKDHADIVEMLLKARADPNPANKNGNTALIWASEKGHTAIVEMLLNAGTNTNLANKNGNTALIIASHNDHAAIVEMLLNAGANTNLANKNGNTALMEASGRGHTAIVKMLLDAGADLNLVDRWGYTALMRAFRYGHIERMLEDAKKFQNEKSQSKKSSGSLDLKTLKVKELRSIATKYKIKGRSKATTKDKLIALLRDNLSSEDLSREINSFRPDRSFAPRRPQSCE